MSDLHFAADTDPMALYQPLAQDIGDQGGDLGFSTLDYLVISGDLTQHAFPKEFEQVHRFLDHLFDKFGLSPERCLICPGIHDLSWDEPVYVWQQARLVKESTLKPGSWTKQGDVYLLRRDDSYGKRFENFARFFKERMQRDYPLEPEQQGIALLSERDRIQLVGLNSAWEIDEWFQGRSSIHSGAVARVLEQADAQVASALKDGRMASDKDLLRIAAWHHPATGNDKIDNDAFIDRLRKANVRLCLHGHVHEERADLVRYLDPRKLHVSGAGSFGAVAKDRPESTPRLYNVLELMPDRSLIRVHTRCLRKEGGAWEGWAVWAGDDKCERRTF